jgi:hypothetical protein
MKFLVNFLNKWFVQRRDFEMVKAQLDEVLYQADRLNRDRTALQKEVEVLERQALELFKNRLDQRRRMFPGNPQEQLSVLRTAYPRLGDLYIKQYEELD